ncbi:MAG: ATP-dependent helicase [Casimicrobiaceae bacterium]
MPDGSAILGELNEAQRRVVAFGVADADVHPPLLVIAGAGTGKTNTIAHRVARLIGDGADPSRILLLTFSRRAAAELETRAGRVVGKLLRGRDGDVPVALPWAGTFHGAGAKLLRLYAERIALVPEFTIHDRGDSEDLMGIARTALAVDVSSRRFPSAGACLAIYSRIVNAQRALGDVLSESFPRWVEWEGELAQLLAAYVDAKQAQHVLDFDDLLLYWDGMLADEALAEDVASLFDYVLVDEYQDTNRLQGSILSRLKPSGQGVTVVGDDAQAIYGFRAAEVRNILDFPSLFEPPATTMTLDVNYRSAQAILDASNAVMSHAAERFTKNLAGVRGIGERPLLVTVKDESDQARYVAEDVLACREQGMPLKSQAVLFRTSSHSAPLELELARRNIPFVKYGGLKFLDAAHVKDVLCALRWAHNPRDRLAAYRVLRLLPGIGPAHATRLGDCMADGAEVDVASLPRGCEEHWPLLIALLARLRAPHARWPADVDDVLAWYEPHLMRIHEDGPSRALDLAALSRIAATYPSRERFLTEITLDPPSASSAMTEAPRIDDDYLVLSTIHSAKGQEWRSVTLLNAVDGCIPSDMATGRAEDVEEERRLLYVAMTRARDRLAIVVPQRFYVAQQSRGGDRHVYASRSRFLTAAVCDMLDSVTWPVAANEKPHAPGPRAAVDVAARIRDTWRNLR